SAGWRRPRQWAKKTGPVAANGRGKPPSARGPPPRFHGLPFRAEPALALGEVHLHLGVIPSPGQMVDPLAVAVDIALDRTALRRGFVVLGPARGTIVPGGLRRALPDTAPRAARLRLVCDVVDRVLDIGPGKPAPDHLPLQIEAVAETARDRAPIAIECDGL